MMTPAMRMFEFQGGCPWVIAPNASAAHAMATQEGYTLRSLEEQPPRLVPSDEPFTMFWTDFEEGDEGPCDYGCDEGKHNHVTMDASEWCAEYPEGYVIGEFEG